MSRAAHPDFQIVPNERARRIARFSRDEVIALYEESLPVPDDMRDEFHGFDLWECESSKLVYPDPARPGTSRFYAWITQETGYYPTSRPEWTIIGDHAATLTAGDEILDVGSGAGHLLDYLGTRSKARLHGLDATPRSIEICRAKGHTAHLGLLADLVADPGNHGRFAIVVMTHLIEHVPQPVRLMEEALTLLKRDGGRLFVSTPHSPTMYEMTGYHGKNLPPHHLTRWRSASYEGLAERFGLKLALDALDTQGRFLGVLSEHFAACLRLDRPGRPQLALQAALHPIRLLRSLRWVRAKREQANGGVIGSNVLATFRF